MSSNPVVKLIKLPLHYQIGIALVFGTALGLFVNPGDVSLEDDSVKLELSAGVAGANDRIELNVDDERGIESFQKTYPDLAKLENSYPEFARHYRDNPPPADGSTTLTETIEVTDRRVHITEDGKSIAFNYTRKHNGKTVVTTDKAANESELKENFPHWDAEYKIHGGGWQASVGIWAKFVGDLFLRLLKMVTIPLIVTSLVTGVAGLGSTSRLGSMFGKTMLYYLSTSLLAITTGIVMVNLIRPGIGAELPGGGGAVVGEGEQSLGGIFVGLMNNMIPPNPVASMAGAEFLSIITFSILIGIFIIRTGGDSGETLRRFFSAGFEMMMNMTMFIIRLAPIGVFAFILFATATQGLEIFKTLAWYMLTVFLALVVHAVIVLPLILKFVARRSPVKFAQAMSPALMTAFSTASSNGTLPLTMNSVEQRAGVSNRISSFVLPLGATINMDGTALYEAVAVLFIAQAYLGDVPLGAQILVAITALLASIGAAGIPHAGLVMMAIVLQAVGLPLEAQGIIIAVDRLLDMCRTSVNVWSDSCGCAVLQRFEPADVVNAAAPVTNSKDLEL